MNTDALLVRRYLECSAFVLLWMAAQFYFRIWPIANQLVGIPLTVLFQIAVARRPLRKLWAFDATAFRVDTRMLVIAAGVVLGCGALLWFGRHHAAAGLEPRGGLFLLVLAAALPAAFALRQQRAGDFGRALPWVLLAAVFRVGWHWVWGGGAIAISPEKLPDFFAIWACETVALFLVDEVVFRGAIDPYLKGEASGRLHACCSAVFCSILWSIWHLPSYFPDARSFGALFARISPWYLYVVVLGTLFSFAARKARTLVPTAIGHALGNAYILALIR